MFTHTSLFGFSSIDTAVSYLLCFADRCFVRESAHERVRTSAYMTSYSVRTNCSCQWLCTQLNWHARQYQQH
jgi:hypothetical protein